MLAVVRTARPSDRCGRKCRSYSLSVLWRAVPGRRRSWSRPGECPGRRSPAFASTPPVCRWPGWDHCRTPWLGGRPSPTWGHAGPGRDRHRRVPTRLSGGPEPRQQADHRLVAALPSVTCSCPGSGGKTSISQRAHTLGCSQTASRTDRSARRPFACPMVKPRVPDQTLPRRISDRPARGPWKPRQPHQLAAPRTITNDLCPVARQVPTRVQRDQRPPWPFR
jgi:hypothetical protein